MAIYIAAAPHKNPHHVFLYMSIEWSSMHIRRSWNILWQALCSRLDLYKNQFHILVIVPTREIPVPRHLSLEIHFTLAIYKNVNKYEVPIRTDTKANPIFSSIESLSFFSHLFSRIFFWAMAS
jgi:hypothetical protein